MAASSLLALIDDIATLLDDVSLMTKAATKKTAGVLGDDLALNAEQVSGVRAARELPVVWAVCKGSLVNKAILVPAAVAISYFAPWLVIPLLMVGGGYLSYEGFEKVAHSLFSHGADAPHKQALRDALDHPETDLRELEKDKIRGAIRTDFILSAEIITITLGTVSQQTIGMQFAVLAIVAVLITLGVYGLVAGIVKLDDLGLYLTRRAQAFAQKVGYGLLWLAPRLMKTLSVLGTVAMFLVGGGILVHGLPMLSEAIHHVAEAVPAVPTGVVTVLADAVVGLAAGAVLMGVVTPLSRFWQARKAQ